MRIGMLCPENHEVFEEVKLLLEERNIVVDFLDPEVYHEPDELATYNGIMLKKSREKGFKTLRDAEKNNIPTFNGFRTHMKANHNIASYWHLENYGINVPEVSCIGLNGEVVVKPKTETMREEPWKGKNLGQSNNHFYQRFIENGAKDYKLYVTETGAGINITSLSADSKLLCDDVEREKIEVDANLEKIAKKSIEAFDARMLGIDVIRSESGEYVVDVNSAPSYRGTDDEDILAKSIYNFIDEQN